MFSTPRIGPPVSFGDDEDVLVSSFTNALLIRPSTHQNARSQYDPDRGTSRPKQTFKLSIMESTLINGSIRSGYRPNA